MLLLIAEDLCDNVFSGKSYQMAGGTGYIPDRVLDSVISFV